MGAFQPSDDETHDLGTTSARWQNVHADKLVISGEANDASTLTSTFGGHLTVSGKAALGTSTELEIDGGVVAVTKSYHKIATEGVLNNDDLDTINGGVDGMIVILQATNDDDTVNLKDGTGNLKLAGDCTLDNSSDTIQLIYNGTNWCEISRSNNDT